MSSKTKGMSRRVFLTRASAGIAGLALAPHAVAQMRGGGGGGMGGGGTGGGTSGGIVDPPVGGALIDPPIAPSAAPAGSGVVDVTVRASAETVALNGGLATLLTYNGSFIAPTIRARRGDRVRLHFTNDLPAGAGTNLLGHPRNVTNVHVHGWHVSPGDNALGIPADNVHVTIPPGGGTQEYEYDLSLQRPGTLALYHPHVHGTVAEQFWGGLVGALDVEDHPITSLAGIDTRILVLKDLALASGAPAPYASLMEYMQGKEGDLVTVNAQVNPSLAMRPGEVKRLRLLNASNARFYRLALQGHRLHVVGTDGGLLDRPYPVPEILMSPGERVDVLVQASAKGSYKLLALPYARHGSMASAQITLLTLQVSGRAAAGALPAVVDPAAARLAGDTSMLPRAQFALSMGRGRGYINGVTFDVLADGTIQAAEHHSTVDTEEIWEIVNQSGMDHPWHQHVNDGQVIGMSGGDAAIANYARLYTQAPAFKDTIIVPKWGSVTLRLPIRDHAGMTMFHCHILEHEDIGMMGMWHIMEDGMPMPM